MRELIQVESVAPHDWIVVATSGHSVPDCPVEVISITRGEHPVMWIRLPDGRTSIYVPSRMVFRLADTEG